MLHDTTSTARQVIESLVRDSRAALAAVRRESLVALQSAMLKHETAFRALYETLLAEVIVSFLEYAWSLMPRRKGCDRSGGWLQRHWLRCLPRACLKLNHRRVLTLFSELILGVRRRTWEAVLVPDLPPTAFLPFELDFRMSEGPSRDRETSRDVEGHDWVRCVA